MLVVSFTLLSLAVVIGGFMLAGRLYRVAVVHGALGGFGLAALFFAWKQARLSGPFAIDALVLLALAFAGGLGMAALHWRGRPSPGLLLFLHASFGGLAYLLLAGFVFHR